MRSRHVAFRWNHILIIHGGSDKATPFGDIFAFDVENLKWMNWNDRVSYIEPRRDHCGVVFNGKFYIYGGKYGSKYCQPIWHHLDLEELCGKMKNVIQFSSYKKSGKVLTFGFSGHGALGNSDDNKKSTFRSTPLVIDLKENTNKIIKIRSNKFFFFFC
jgi:hypothetical protein